MQNQQNNSESNSDTVDGNNPDIRYSSRNYSYDALTSKPDMKVTEVNTADVPNNRADVIYYAKMNAAKIGKFNTKDGSVSVHVNDIDIDVVLGKDGLKHSLDRRFSENAPVTFKAGEILQNSIRINELTPQNSDAKQSYVLIGVASGANQEMSIVRFVVNRFSNEVASMDVLYAINTKKDSTAALNAPRVSTPSYRTTISISNLLDYVNKYFPDILPEEVLRHYGHASRPDGKLGESALYSSRSKNYDTLKEQNEKQAEVIKTLKNEFRLSGEPKYSRETAKKVCRKLLKDFGGKMDIDKLTDRFIAIGESFADSKSEFTEEDYISSIYELAGDIVDTIDTSMLDPYSSDVIDDIKYRPFSLTEAQKAEARYAFGSVREFLRAIAGGAVYSRTGQGTNRSLCFSPGVPFIMFVVFVVIDLYAPILR